MNQPYETLEFEARLRGRSDFRRGKDLHENPCHQRHTKEAWEMGWREEAEGAGRPKTTTTDQS